MKSRLTKLLSMVTISALLATMLPLFLAVPVYASGSISLSPNKGPSGTIIAVSGSGFAASTNGDVWFDTDNDNVMDVGEPQTSVTTTAGGALPSGVTLTAPTLSSTNYYVRADIPSGGSVEASATFQKSGTTSQVTVTKHDAYGNVIGTPQTVTWQYLNATLPVIGNGTAHYELQGPTFDDSNRWDPSQSVNLKDYGAMMGSDLADICNLTGGGMSPGDTVVTKASDNFQKTWDYELVYNPPSRQGKIIICWYTTTTSEGGTGGYVPDFTKGMRLFFAPDDLLFSDWDEHECWPKSRWYYYSGQYPTTTGGSVQMVYNVDIYQPKFVTCDSSGTYKDTFSKGETVYVKGLGMTASASYHLWIQPEPVYINTNSYDGWTNFPLVSGNDPSEDGQENASTNGSGDFTRIAIWTIPDDWDGATEFDVVADNQNTGATGYFDSGDFIDNPGFKGFNISP